MVVENVKEMWTKVPKSGKAKKKYKPVNKDRYIYKMFLTWDSDIMVLQNHHCGQVGASSPPSEYPCSFYKDLPL
uniref:Small nuclear ribonucleoprotein Sm D2 n=1 Tax=Ursus maritimus TaxID=29073 RepID=A0A452V9S6_URSMA